MASPIPTVEAVTGFEMPLVGYGTWQAEAEVLESALNNALKAGYRHIDTAYAYGNESVIGRVLQEWFSSEKLKREDIFVTTKLPFMGNRPEQVEKFIDLSLKSLQLSYVDLYLIHTPFGMLYQSDEDIIPLHPDGTGKIDFSTDIVAIWKKMEEQVDNGKTRAIGISNFNMEQVQRILKAARIRPVTDQIQLHIYYQQPDLVKFLQENGIIVTSYSTLGTAGTVHLLKRFGVEKELPNILKHPVVTEIASEIERTPAQVLLRHMVQRNIVVIPKSVNPERIQENLQLFDFKLSEEQMDRLDALDENQLIFYFTDLVKDIDTHPEYHYGSSA